MMNKITLSMPKFGQRYEYQLQPGETQSIYSKMSACAEGLGLHASDYETITSNDKQRGMILTDKGTPDRLVNRIMTQNEIFLRRNGSVSAANEMFFTTPSHQLDVKIATIKNLLDASRKLLYANKQAFPKMMKEIGSKFDLPII